MAYSFYRINILFLKYLYKLFVSTNVSESMLLALDLGTRCGWCKTDGHTFDGGTLNLTPRRFDGGGMRYLRFREQLAGLLGGTERVAFEEVRRHQGVDAAHVYGGLMAVLTEECERRGIPYEGVPVGTIKKRATGKGNANKDAMLSAAAEKWPGREMDDNEADARWLAVTVLG